MSLSWLAVALAQPIAFDTLAFTSAGDTSRFYMQIPSSYDPEFPPALLVGWHALGGSQYEIFAHEWDEWCEERGWIIASHMGPNDRHWNTRLPQLHCRAMLEWIEENFPFSRDSIYMCGGSMGAAAGQVWHNNNCAYDDYFIAATAGGSQILDCQLRQEQYLADGDTNFSMRVAFGGFPFESDSIAYEYHRYSAVHLADTTRSMHFNCLTVPVWSNWGAEEFEWFAYGNAALEYQILRRFGAESNFGPAAITGHGFNILWAEAVMQWFATYSANRFPDTLSLAADEDGRYYFCDVVLGDQPYSFARWEVRKDSSTKSLELDLLRNVSDLTVNFVFPWTALDTLYCSWSLIDSLQESATVRLAGLQPGAVALVDGTPRKFVNDSGELSFALSGTQEFVLTLDTTLDTDPLPIPEDLLLVSAYPNPFNSELSLVVASERARSTVIELFDLRGRLAYSLPATLVPGMRTVHLSLPGLASGIYFLRVEDAGPLKVLLIR
ncbi:MAG: T9SS type A sorting domain-containing protein [Calditrichaeota bacterium]|nr:T9SS type A sorting domain-containing protein [Calditrichota bacterium]